MTEMQWHSARVYGYSEKTDDLILKWIRPLLYKVSTTKQKSFFVPSWSRDPYVQLHFYCGKEYFEKTIKPLLEEDRKIYSGIQYIPGTHSSCALNDTELGELLEDFYMETNDITFSMLDATKQGLSAFTLSFDLMVTIAHTFGTHLMRSFSFYHSQVEDFILKHPKSQAMQALFDQKYQEQSAVLTKRLRRLLEALDLDEDVFPFVLTWRELATEHWQQLERLLQNKRFDKESDYVPYEDPKDSQAASWQQRYRLMLRLLYLHLKRLGIRPLDLLLSCYFVVKATEQVFGYALTTS